MKNNQIHFNVHNNQVKVSYKSTPSIEDFLTITLSGTLLAMNQIVDSQPEELRESCRNDLYDMFNHGASNTLAMFAPELELRPNLTTAAILEAENKLIEEHAQRCKQEGKTVPFPFAD